MNAWKSIRGKRTLKYVWKASWSPTMMISGTVVSGPASGFGSSALGQDPLHRSPADPQPPRDLGLAHALGFEAADLVDLQRRRSRTTGNERLKGVRPEDIGRKKVKTVLITGAGSGFGLEVAMRLAEKGFDVIAAVEIYAQVQTLKRQAAARGVSLRVEKLDVTNEGDRKKALAWDVEILVNNAGVLEGGSVVDIPAANMRSEFEVNVIGPLLLTQGIAKQMVKRGRGRIVWVSSREGLNVNPFTGIYAASKHAIEAIAETMSLELREFGLEVATINPGPFLTGFNDRGFETWKSWEDDPSERLFDYSKLAFPRAQFDPEPVYATMTAVAAGEIDTYRNLEPKSMLAETKGNIEAVWDKKIRDGLGTRPPGVQKSYDMKPETPVE